MRLFSREGDPAQPAGRGEGSVADVLGVASDRIRGIVEAAERAATDISAKVRASPGMQGEETSRISRERLVAELAQSLVTRAEELSREAGHLADILERASSRLDVTPAGFEVADTASQDKPARPSATSNGSGGYGPPEEAVLRATQMAVAGSSRSEIDAKPVVNDILGPA